MLPLKIVLIKFPIGLIWSHRAQRARNIQKGELLTIDRDDDKNTVIALREIADETIDFYQIEDRIIQSMQRLNESEEEVTVSDDASATAMRICQT